jgi:hypothetical protein
MQTIKGKIAKVEVVKGNSAQPSPAPIVMSEAVERPEILEGRSYKIKPNDHAYYITISDIWLNRGTEHEVIRPYEIFINTKDMSAFMWIAGLSRMISAVMRKGGDLHFVIEELLAVHDPNGGYWAKGSYVPSIVAGIGQVIDQHLKWLNGEAVASSDVSVPTSDPTNRTVLPQCPKCMNFTMVVQEGCATCTSCAYSKCG